MTTNIPSQCCFNDLSIKLIHGTAFLLKLLITGASTLNGKVKTQPADRSLSHRTRCHSYRSLDTWATPRFEREDTIHCWTSAT